MDLDLADEKQGIMAIKPLRLVPIAEEEDDSLVELGNTAEMINDQINIRTAVEITSKTNDAVYETLESQPFTLDQDDDARMMPQSPV